MKKVKTEIFDPEKEIQATFKAIKRGLKNYEHLWERSQDFFETPPDMEETGQN